MVEIDFETYSEAGYYWDEAKNKWRAPDGFPKSKPGLPSIGAAKYAEHPTTKILSLSYNLKDGVGPRLWVPGMEPPADLHTHIVTGGLLEAWNSFFEFIIWHYVCHLRMKWPTLPLYQMRCAMAKAAAYGLPGQLEKAAKVINAPEQKLDTGKSLIRRLCCPRNPTKGNLSKRIRFKNDPQSFAQLYDYNVQDIKAEAAVSALVPDLTPDELELWQIDQQINVRGVQIDMEALGHCMSIVQQATNKYTVELRTITGIPDLTVDKLQQIKGWMVGQGVLVASLDKQGVVDTLGRENLPPDICRVLEIRQILGSAGVKKLYALNRSVNTDGRVRDLYAYYGARQTGRFSGRGAQPQNLTSGGPEVVKCDICNKVQYIDPLQICCDNPQTSSIDWGIKAAEIALKDIATCDLNYVEQQWGDPIDVVSGCLRALFVAAPGKELICSDYSAIEAVVLAELAGETWRQEVFRTHGKIYEMSAAKISGIPFEEFQEHKKRTGQHHPLRKTLGKVAELASGYQGWINAWKNFNADKFMTDEEIKQAILKWRAESPAIVEYWGGQWRKHPDYWEFNPELYGIEGTAIKAIQSPGTQHTYRGIIFEVRKKILYLRLLSGRELTYHNPRLMDGTAPHGHPISLIMYDGWRSDSSKGPVGWHTMFTYGGCWTENITQATARDLFVEGMKQVDAAGYPVVLHSHDELISEVPIGYGSILEYERLMAPTSEWSRGWPIKAAGGWRGKRYRKE